MEIKTCPHCGGDASLIGKYASKARSYIVFCKCDICGAQGKVYNSQEDPQEKDWSNAACMDAVKAWNMRVADRAN